MCLPYYVRHYILFKLWRLESYSSQQKRVGDRTESRSQTRWPRRNGKDKGSWRFCRWWQSAGYNRCFQGHRRLGVQEPRPLGLNGEEKEEEQESASKWTASGVNRALPKYRGKQEALGLIISGHQKSGDKTRTRLHYSCLRWDLGLLHQWAGSEIRPSPSWKRTEAAKEAIKYETK